MKAEQTMSHHHHHHHHHQRHHEQANPSEVLSSETMSSSSSSGSSSSIEDDPVSAMSEHRPYDAIRAKELEYYSDYDSSVGARIALTLGVLILLFTVFVIYKSHCHVRKARRLVASVQAQYSVQQSNNQTNTEQVH